MKAIAYFEGKYTPYRGKFLNAIVRYKKHCLLGVYSKEPSETLVDYLKQNQIKLLTNFEDIPKDCTHFVFTLLDFPSWDYVQTNIEPSLKFCAQRNIKIVNGTFKLLSVRYPEHAHLIWDIRKHDPDYQPDYFIDKLRHKAQQLRILTVGTDSTVGKMTAGLELTKALLEKGHDAKFIATGQIGIFLSGEGLALDSTIIDFSRGMLEEHLLKQNNRILIVEGQGSIVHPVYFGTATTLIYASAPQMMILCGHMQQKTIRTIPYWPIPDYKEVIRRTEEMARTVCPSSTIAALSLNTSDFDEETALAELNRQENELRLPVTDAVRFGTKKLVEAIETHLAKYAEITFE